mgnify:CR=1 FL=1
MLRLAPAKKGEDFAHWAETGMKGAPPAEPVGGVVGLDSGGRGSFTANLSPGNYGALLQNMWWWWATPVVTLIVVLLAVFRRSLEVEDPYGT